MEYFIIENGKQAGPYTIDQLFQKHITSETLVWTNGMTAWTPAWQVGELKYILNAENATGSVPPPYPGDTTSSPDHEAESPHQGPEGSRTQEQDATTQEQTGTQAASTNAKQEETPPKKDHSIVLGITLIVFALLCLFAFTCPNKEDHKEALKAAIIEQLNQEADSSSDDVFSIGVGILRRMMQEPVVDATLNQVLTVHKYIVFSKGSVSVGGHEYTVSIGLLHKVFPVNNGELTKVLKDATMGNNPASSSFQSGTDTDDSAGGTDGQSPSQEDDGESSTGEESTMQGAAPQPNSPQATRRLRDKVASTVADEVKKQVAQQSDSTTSNVVGALIDEFTTWLKGL